MLLTPSGPGSPARAGRRRRSWRLVPGRGAIWSWRRTRPFWGGLVTVLAGAELLSIPFALDAFPWLIRSVEAGMAHLISVLIIVLGVLILVQPAQRVLLGVLAVVLSIVSILYANVGGFLLGAVLGLVGGALAAAWGPEAPSPESRGPRGSEDRSDAGGAGELRRTAAVEER
ncbi:DUF6114 domain-containing protein [Sphaerisporangium sp. TRM90804]|uniref:DUF6114 domain-containing protein n=1 Tax=Sphaerisporangium sp. TRM90804 TaxID=3031113 RepID=UPI00244C531B|nr:DUF6114 domain-containing protein [Sphaerisporangium sp. TRM90804]MDH2426857.1 DUF6114 domain-containing protein [Sphaerisporangium sp. TRM90804]